MTHAPEWTDEHDAVITQHYPKRGGRYVAELLQRSIGAVHTRAGVIKVRREWPIEKRRPSKPASAKPAPVEATNPRGVVPQVAPPFVDRRFTPAGPVPRVVDAAECREWARSAA